MTRAAALVVGLLLVGSITLDYPAGASTTRLQLAEVRMEGLAPGSTGGANGTDATASVAGTLLALRTDVLWLNNTNATGEWHARLVATSSTGVTNFATLAIGIDNGTAAVDQVVGLTGVLTQTTGPHVRLPPGSASRIYLTQAVTTLGLTSSVTLEVRAADAPTEDAVVLTTATLTVT